MTVQEIAVSLDVLSVDCAITLAIKIIDDSCQMDDRQCALFMELYDHLPYEKSTLFDETVIGLIAIARNDPSSFVFSEIRELKKTGMEHIGRPAMKAFKSQVRTLLDI